MTNDNDKLRDLLSRCRDIIGEHAPGHSVILDELDVALSEPSSPAPAAAPSDVEIAAAEQEADEIVAKAKNDNTAQPVGLSKHLRRRISEALMRRAADAKEQTK